MRYVPVEKIWKKQEMKTKKKLSDKLNGLLSFKEKSLKAQVIK